MGFHPLMRTRFRAYVELPQDEVLEQLDDVENTRGKVGERDFSFTWKLKGFRNSWQPNIKGHVLPAGEGSLVEADLKVHPFVLVFTALHAIPFLGLSWLMGVAAFSWHANKAIAGMRELLGPTVEDPDAISAMQQTADPTTLGAEANAPWSLRATMRKQNALFSLETDGWLGPRTTDLRVNQRGVTVGERTMTWDELQRAEVVIEGAARHLDLVGDETVSIEANRVPGRDLMWLKDYINATDRRFGASAEELDDARARLRQLNSLRSARRTER